eukprot:7684412-Pyramimonas_sp.AAC.1
MKLRTIRLCQVGLAPEPDNKSPAKTAFHIVASMEQGASLLRACPKDQVRRAARQWATERFSGEESALVISQANRIKGEVLFQFRVRLALHFRLAGAGFSARAES